eukprot:379738-Hanusia_phi.AAC.1
MRRGEEKERAGVDRTGRESQRRAKLSWAGKEDGKERRNENKRRHWSCQEVHSSKCPCRRSHPAQSYENCSSCELKGARG